MEIYIKDLASFEAETRFGAARVLSKAKAVEAVPALSIALSDTERRVSRQAQHALQLIAKK